MPSWSNINGHVNPSVIQEDVEIIHQSAEGTSEQYTINILDNRMANTRMSVDGSRIIADLSPRITITFHHLSKVITVPAKMIDPTSKEKTLQRTLLDQISGRVYPGQLVAVMGPSGSGKTTLLNILGARTLNGVTGDIWINNQRYKKSMKRRFAYILQQDIFFENLTVKQQLIYTALLRLPNTLTRKDKLLQVEEIIEQLRLQTCANTPILLISGGEKKRVNIATELLTNPSVILLDEPTSGLDSTSAIALIGVLREMASKGKTIITSIHQPSSHIFHTFDQLILLADGKTIFMGQPSNATNYFATLGHRSPAQYNPADFILDLVNQDLKVRDELKEAYRQNTIFNNTKQQHNESQKYLIGEPSSNEEDLPCDGGKNEKKWPIGFWAQTSILFRRNWILTSKSQFSKLNCIQALCLSIVFGLFWLRMKYNESTLNDRSSFLYFMMIFWPFEISFAGILSFLSERTVIEKERASGSFRLSTYYLAKCLSETPLKLVLPTISFTIAYWMANMNSNFGIFLGTLVFLLMVILVAETIGLLFGASFEEVGQAWVAGNVTFLGLLLAGGYFIANAPYWLIIWTKWLSFYKYGYDASLRLQFMGDRLYECVNGAWIDVCRNKPNGTFTGDDALLYFKVDLSIGFNFLVLFGMFITFRFAAYMALRFIRNRRGRT